MSIRSTGGVMAAVVAVTLIGSGGRSADAQTVTTIHNGKTAVTVVGCLQSERQYRREHESSKFAGTGIGLDDEYVLVDAIIGGPAMEVRPVTEAESNCAASRGTGQAFELSGHGEDQIGSLIGRRVVIHGLLKHAERDAGAIGTSGTFTPAPTHGGPSLGTDLELREVNVESFTLAPVMAAARNEPEIFGAPEPQANAPAAEAAPQTPAAAPAPAPAAALPKTASPLPTIGLLGLLSLAGAFGLRLWNRLT